MHSSTTRLLDRFAAGPARGPAGGYGETVPRPAAVPSFARIAHLSRGSTVTSIVNQTNGGWEDHAVMIGTRILQSIAADLRALPLVTEPTRATLLVSSGISSTTLSPWQPSEDCSEITADQLCQLAEAVLKVAVESRLWACAVLRASFGLAVVSDKLITAVISRQSPVL